MNKRGYVLVIYDEENNQIFDHKFNYENGKIKFLPSSNKIAKIIKNHMAKKSEFDPK